LVLACSSPTDVCESTADEALAALAAVREANSVYDWSDGSHADDAAAAAEPLRYAFDAAWSDAVVSTKPLPLPLPLPPRRWPEFRGAMVVA
jgi:hypothetical protein